MEFTLIRCIEGKWTQDVGSTSADQCREYPLLHVGSTLGTAPGFKLAQRVGRTSNSPLPVAGVED